MSDLEAPVEAPVEEGAPAWMATFGDLMSLLLTFFVLLMSFASMDTRRFAAVTGSMRDAFGVQRVHPGDIEALASSPIALSDTESSPFLRVIDVPTRLPERHQSLLQRIEMAMKDNRLERLIQVESTAAGVVMRVPGQMLFSPGSAELRPESIVFLHEIAELIRATPGDVSIDGHTDPSPVGSGPYRSNWQLSAERAVSTLVHLVEVEGIEEGRLRATGYGASRPLPDEAGDGAVMRRVEFVFLREPGEFVPTDAADAGDEDGETMNQGSNR